MIRLSKSKFTTGLQCHRLLWWTVHERDAPELLIDPAQQAIFDQGTRVGELAREYVPGGQLVDLPHWAVDRRIEATRAAIAGGARVIYEASFLAGDVFVAVDILHRTPRKREWTLTEVKSTTRVKDEHLPDTAVQTHVLRRAGLRIARAEVMHLNRECRYPDLSNLFTRSDVTDAVEELLRDVPGEVAAQLATLRGPAPPDVTPGDQCTAPYECPFLDRCWEPPPAHHIGTLCALTATQCDALIDRGYETIFDLPDDIRLSAVQDRQRRAVRSGTMVVEPGLRKALAGVEPPVAHLDFETINPAIPVWPGCRPYDHVPAQFSVHVEPTSSQGQPKHFAWLAEGADDPRPPLARALVDALRGARSIIVYHQPFEAARLRELQEAVPELAGELEDVIARIVDLLPIVRSHVYHPDFGGSFGLKNVAPALVPTLGYDELEIGEGSDASRILEVILLRADTLNAAEVRRLRRALLAYCEQDTLATVGVLRRLREVAG